MTAQIGMTKKTRHRRLRPKPFSGPQLHALKLAELGPLRSCGRGFRDAHGDLVKRTTARSLIERGWLVIAATDGHGQPTRIEHVGAQIDFAFESGEAPSPAGDA